MQSNNITNIDFVKNLPKLQYLDITDNNVMDLTPAMELTSLKSILCGKNAINKGLELGDKINVDLETVHKDNSLIW